MTDVVTVQHAKKSHRAINASTTRTDWCTPQRVVDRLLLLGPIGLDPCSNAASIVPAETRWTAAHGGESLRKSWDVHGNWYCNPSYGVVMPKWCAKMAREGAVARSSVGSAFHGIGMVPANTGSGWFADFITSATEILFWSPRLNFVGSKTSNTQDMATPYWGRDPEAFRRAFHGCGWFRGPAC